MSKPEINNPEPIKPAQPSENPGTPLRRGLDIPPVAPALPSNIPGTRIPASE